TARSAFERQVRPCTFIGRPTSYIGSREVANERSSSYTYRVPAPMIRTKIVATIGPACSEVQTLLDLFEAGADVCRLNFSHGTVQTHLQTLRNIHEAAARYDYPIAILGDLSGPKIRLGEIAGDGMQVKPGDTLILQRAPIVGANMRASTTIPTLIDDIQPGDRLYIEDGQLRFICTDKRKDEISLSCLVGGTLRSHKGINLPNTKLSVNSLTDRDWQFAEWAIENGLDYLALSFVRRPDEI